MLTDVRLTPEQYLEAERIAETRHEFVDGVMHAMAGDKKCYNRVVGRLYRLANHVRFVTEREDTRSILLRVEDR